MLEMQQTANFCLAIIYLNKNARYFILKRTEAGRLHPEKCSQLLWRCFGVGVNDKSVGVAFEKNEHKTYGTIMQHLDKKEEMETKGILEQSTAARH